VGTLEMSGPSHGACAIAFMRLCGNSLDLEVKVVRRYTNTGKKVSKPEDEYRHGMTRQDVLDGSFCSPSSL